MGVHAPAPGDRLVAALQDLGAHNREKPYLRIVPDQEKLRGVGHHLLLTRAGPLDVLRTVVRGDSRDELRSHSWALDLGSGITVRVLDPPALIRMKEQLGRVRDRAVLAILRRTREEQG